MFFDSECLSLDFGSEMSTLVAQRLKHLPAMRETWVRSLGQEVPLGKEMATHSSILAWRIPRTEEPGGLQFTGSQRVGHDWATSLYFFGIRMKTDLFQSCSHCWVFQNWWHIECSTLTASSFRILNSSAGILSPPLDLFIVILLRPTRLCILGCLALGEWSHHCDVEHRKLW